MALRCSDFDLIGGTVKVERSRTFTLNERSIEKEPKTSPGVRQLSIPANLIPIIEDHIRAFCIEANDSLVFICERGSPITAGVLQKVWTRARNLVSRPDLHFHDLRHTGLTLRGGHSSSQATLRYQHATRDRDTRLASFLEERMERET